MDIGFPAPSYLPSFVQKRLGEANTSMSHVNVEHHTSIHQSQQDHRMYHLRFGWVECLSHLMVDVDVIGCDRVKVI